MHSEKSGASGVLVPKENKLVLVEPPEKHFRRDEKNEPCNLHVERVCLVIEHGAEGGKTEHDEGTKEEDDLRGDMNVERKEDEEDPHSNDEMEEDVEAQHHRQRWSLSGLVRAVNFGYIIGITKTRFPGQPARAFDQNRNFVADPRGGQKGAGDVGQVVQLGP